MRCWVLVVLLAAAGVASAEDFQFEGELTFKSPSDTACGAMSAGSYRLRIVGRSGAGGLEGFLYGDKLIRASIRGRDPSRLALYYNGESNSHHDMRLRLVAPGMYTGELQGNATLAAMYNCPMASAHIEISKTLDTDPAAFAREAHQYEVDARAVQSLNQGLQGKVNEAIPVLEQAMAATQQLYGATQPQLLPYAYFLGQLHVAQGSLPAALPLDRQALQICEKSDGPNSACTAAMLVNLGGDLANDGVYPEAESMLRRALGICDALFGAASPIRGDALNALGFVLLHTGRYGEAGTTLEEALALNRKRPNPDNAFVAVSLNNFGALYLLTGQYKKAETALRQAVAVDEKAVGANHALTIMNNINLAGALRISGQFQAAEPIARRALASAEKILGTERQDHPTLARAQVCLAEILRVTGRTTDAEPLLRQAIANGTKYLGPDHPGVAAASLLLAKLLHATGRDPEALRLLGHANVVAHLADDQMIAWQVAGELMEIHATGPSENRFKAIFFGKQAVNDLQKLRGNLSQSSSDTQQAFVGSAEVSAIYRTLAGLLIADGRAPEAQQVLAMVKEQEFFEFTERIAPADAPRTVASLNSGEQRLDAYDARVVALGKEYGALQDTFRLQGDRLSAADRTRLEALRKSMDAAQSNFEQQVTAIAKSAADPEAQRRRRAEINDYSRAFQGTLKHMGHDAVVAQYIVLDDRVAILLTTPNAVVSREAKISRRDLYALIGSFRQNLSSPARKPDQDARALFQLLIMPIAGDLQQAGAKTLMLDLDDILRYVPFAALNDGTHYLIESLAVVMVTEAVRDKLDRPPIEEWSVWGLGVSKGGPGYPALPFANVELSGIAGPKGILKGKVIMDKDFTEVSLRDGLDRAYPIIHVASHFQFTPGSMQDSFLLLGDGRHLTLAQIKTELNFGSVELLTLSACETAVGDDSTGAHGVEVEGLGAIAQQAGAKAVLATLWSVADASTAALMRALYEAHKVDHLDKADALRQSQLALLHGATRPESSRDAERGLTRVARASVPDGAAADRMAPYAHPFYWAPFVLMGNWQ